ncbi:hypothetical protein ACH5RR_011246 [Cinchona calisaya]|uniref:RRM domain-containing protein n=1 Tax=Cinchona calisaya TaxID=153742 RepID=A0ABD3A7V9_9GENT
MAFVSRIGNVLKQRISKHINVELSASNSSLYQTIRSMSSSKVFVGGLSYSTDEMSLNEAFSQHGEVVEARIIMDRVSGRSRGFGFVTYNSSEEASRAISALDGQDLHGRQISVNYANERTRAPRSDGGYGGGGGYNYGGGSGGYGGYQSGNYGGPGGGSGYGSGNYGSSNNYADQYSGNNYGGEVGGGNMGNFGAGGGNNYYSSDSTNQGGYDGNTLLHEKAQDQLNGNQGEADAADVDFGEEALDGNDERSDYVNTRG